MKFKKILFIVLMMFLCCGTVNIKVYAECTSEIDTGSTLAAEAVAVDAVENIVTSNVSETSTTETVQVIAKTTSLKTNPYTNAELRLMSAIIYCEAGGESYAGKLAVGIVVMNRKASCKFPDTIKGVIYQKYQFQPTRNGSMAKALTRYDAGKFTSSSEKACIKAAKAALSSVKTITYKAKTIKLSGYYFFSRQLSGARIKIGNHKFK